MVNYFFRRINPHVFIFRPLGADAAVLAVYAEALLEGSPFRKAEHLQSVFRAGDPGNAPVHPVFVLFQQHSQLPDAGLLNQSFS